MEEGSRSPTIGAGSLLPAIATSVSVQGLLRGPGLVDGHRSDHRHINA